MLKRVKKSIAISIGLAAIARKKAEKELRKAGVSKKRVKGVVKRIGSVALKEGKRVEGILKKEIAKEMKKAKPVVMRAVKKRVKKAKGRVKRILKKRKKCRR